jgi:hypothetical protein
VISSLEERISETIPLAPEQIKPNQIGDKLSGGEDF